MKALDKGGLYLLRADTLGMDTLDEAGIDAIPRAAKVRACKHPEDRKRAFAAELLLEAALGREAVSRIRTAPGGKPYIDASGDGDSGFPFISVSHSGVWAVLAVSDTEVGVDIEEMRPDRDFRGIARKAFALEERGARAADSCVADAKAFYRMWTAKESYVKMLGTSIAAMPSFRVRISDGGNTARVEGDPNTVIHIIEGIEGYMLALALRAGQRALVPLSMPLTHQWVSPLPLTGASFLPLLIANC